MKILTDTDGLGAAGVVVGHEVLVPQDVALGNVGVDLFHGGIVFPTADLHGDFFRHTEVVGEGGEAVAEAVDADLGQASVFTDPVDAVQDGAGVHGNDIV